LPAFSSRRTYRSVDLPGKTIDDATQFCKGAIKMNAIKHMKVKAKILVCVTVLSAIALIIGAMGIMGMNLMANDAEELYDVNLIAIEAMGDMREAFEQERIYLRDMLIYIDDPATVGKNVERLNAAHLKGDAAVQRYVAAVDMS
jgi:hypothetical protein